MITKPPINVQDGFFYQLRKDNTLVEVMLLSEQDRAADPIRIDPAAAIPDSVPA